MSDSPFAYPVPPLIVKGDGGFFFPQFDGTSIVVPQEMATAAQTAMNDAASGLGKRDHKSIIRATVLYYLIANPA